MAESPADAAYIARLARELERNPAPLALAEDELAHLRGTLARVAEWINNPVHDLAARRDLADYLHLPAPRTPVTTKETTDGH